jgi:hypothetical protein
LIVGLGYALVAEGCDSQVTLRGGASSYTLRLQIQKSRVRRFMAVKGRESFICPNCHALYRIVRAEVEVEVGRETVDREITCQACGGPLPGREGRFVIRYFMLRKGGRI